MPECSYESHSPEATRRIGAQLAEKLERGSVVAVRGDLGAGKTCIIQGVCQALAVRDYVTSPTFILINEYRGVLRGEPIDVHHIDLYRLRSVAELEDLGIDEYLYGRGICLIEWPELAAGLLPRRHLEVELAVDGPARRTIVVRSRP